MSFSIVAWTFVGRLQGHAPASYMIPLLPEGEMTLGARRRRGSSAPARIDAEQAAATHLDQVLRTAGLDLQPSILPIATATPAIATAVRTAGGAFARSLAVLSPLRSPTPGDPRLTMRYDARRRRGSGWRWVSTEGELCRASYRYLAMTASSTTTCPAESGVISPVSPRTSVSCPRLRVDLAKAGPGVSDPVGVEIFNQADPDQDDPFQTGVREGDRLTVLALEPDGL